MTDTNIGESSYLVSLVQSSLILSLCGPDPTPHAHLKIIHGQTLDNKERLFRFRSLLFFFHFINLLGLIFSRCLLLHSRGGWFLCSGSSGGRTSWSSAWCCRRTASKSTNQPDALKSGIMKS